MLVNWIFPFFFLREQAKPSRLLQLSPQTWPGRIGKRRSWWKEEEAGVWVGGWLSGELRGRTVCWVKARAELNPNAGYFTEARKTTHITFWCQKGNPDHQRQQVQASCSWKGSCTHHRQAVLWDPVFVSLSPWTCAGMTAAKTADQQRIRDQIPIQVQTDALFLDVFNVIWYETEPLLPLPSVGGEFILFSWDMRQLGKMLH